MRNVLPSLALLILTGCAASTTGNTAASGPPPRLDQVGSGYDIRIDNGGATSDFTLQAAPEAAWTALLAAYQKMGLPPTSMDETQRTVSAADVEARRQLAGKSLSEYLDCGSNLTGLVANSYRVRLTVSSGLKPGPQGGSTLQTSVSASATSPQGASSAPVSCATTGHLEASLAQLVRGGGGA